MMYQNADDPNAAWDNICDIQDVRDDAMTLIRDFVLILQGTGPIYEALYLFS